ncbi:hypothetical protein [Actinoplanes flavus]|uniref:Uncharacterized protein n=1 Tax=Actinoplanes flavus TaxID=2820290 RepID=A0ABS3ULQ7_9ACTN|nr:hypothetical protein [Actinoplanes flavus]MBO3739720.1 hypothetical protein [Actinoplanes flavus]
MASTTEPHRAYVVIVVASPEPRPRRLRRPTARRPHLPIRPPRAPRVPRRPAA